MEYFEIISEWIPTRGKRRRGLRLTTIFPPCSGAVMVHKEILMHPV